MGFERRELILLQVALVSKCGERSSSNDLNRWRK